MKAGVAATWQRLDSAISPNRSFQRKIAKSSSPDLSKRRRTQQSSRKPANEMPSLTKSNVFTTAETFRNQLSVSFARMQSVRQSRSRPATAGLRRSRQVQKTDLPLFLEGVTEVDIQLIYTAKCKDSDIPVLPEQMLRFYELCSRNIKDRKFDLQKCGLGPSAAYEIARLLRNNFHYAQLELGRNILGDKGSVLLIKAISKAVNLVHVGLSSNDISPEGGAIILRSLMDNQSITSLDISSHEGLHRNRLAGKGCEPLTVLFKANPVLVHLNLAGNAIGPEGLDYLSTGFKGNHTVLTLNLANNGLTGRMIEPFTRTVLGSKLRQLDVSGNKFGQSGAECISRMLQGGFEGACPLHHLDISRNDINFTGAARILHTLTRNLTLKSLSLEGNPLGTMNSTDFHIFLSDNKALTTLNLSGCDLKSDGIVGLCDGLVKNHVLTALNLSWNSLEDAGAALIGAVIGRNDTLKSLDLSSNRIRDTGGSALCEGLKQNHYLSLLNLQDNNFHDSTGVLLTEITRTNRNFVKIMVKMNPITQKYVLEMQGNMEINKASLRKSMMPLLKNEIKRLTIRDDAFDELETAEGKKKKEEVELKRQLQESEVRFDRFKAEEERKFAQVKEKLDEVMNVKREVGEEYANLEDEIFVLCM